MYHDYIARKIPAPISSDRSFLTHKETLTRIVNHMVQPNANDTYPEYYIYKDILDTFTEQLVRLETHLNEPRPIADVSDSFIEEYKIMFIKPKQKPVLDLLKNRNTIYENL